MNLTVEESGTGEPVLLVMGLGAAADHGGRTRTHGPVDIAASR